MDAINGIMTEMDREQKELLEMVATESLTKKRLLVTICDSVKHLSIKE
jgi:hypothetical protein